MHWIAADWKAHSHPKTNAVICLSAAKPSKVCGSTSGCAESRLRSEGRSTRAVPLRRVKPTLQVVEARASARSSTTVSLVSAFAPHDTCDQPRICLVNDSRSFRDAMIKSADASAS